MQPIHLDFKQLHEIISFADANPVVWKHICDAVDELSEIEDSYKRQSAKILSLLLEFPELYPLQILSLYKPGADSH